MIKRGSKVVWKRPAFDTVSDDDKTIHHPAHKFEGQCFGILKRRDGEFALIMRHGKSKMAEVPLDQLEETNEGR
ncbi:hypothetical protein [Lactiplantibacillus xiangfangensis]|uniref:hypothetical protein n=1 Tax=Lactiplantibacillus xiangfangensis TaxID=942150 RepID=UPI00384B01FD